MNILVKTHSQLTNGGKIPLLPCRRHIFLGGLLKPCWHLGNEEKCDLPQEDFLNSPSWLDCSLFYIPPALCSTTITVPNTWLLHWESRFAHYIFPRNGTEAPPGQGAWCTDVCGPHDPAWHVRSFRVSWVNEKCTCHRFAQTFNSAGTENWCLLKPTGGTHHVLQRRWTLVGLGAAPWHPHFPVSPW